MFVAVVFVIYIVIGVVVASGHHYFEHLDALKPIASAVLAVLLWPLILFGINLHIKQGRHRLPGTPTSAWVARAENWGNGRPSRELLDGRNSQAGQR